jgi:hypothetical protein
MYENEAAPLDSALVDTVERGEELLLRAQVVGGQSMYDLVRSLAAADPTSTPRPVPSEEGALAGGP